MNPDELAALRAQVKRDRAELSDAIRIRKNLDDETRARVDAALARERQLAESEPLAMDFGDAVP